MRAENVAALIERQSQEFSDASASGDAATIAKYLDDRVIFMNETGEISDKKGIVDGTQPTPKNIQRKLTQSDFKVEVHGDVAVTSFTDNLDQQLYGQTLKIKYLSTEVWKKEGADWKMISSQTMTKPDDPKTVALPASTLDEYVGTYEATPAFKMQHRARGRWSGRYDQRRQTVSDQSRTARRARHARPADASPYHPARCERQSQRTHQPPRRTRLRAETRGLMKETDA